MAASKKVAEAPSETKLDDNVTDPSTVAPGDAPADTTDPTEHASTVVPTPSAEALKQGTVNGVLPIDGPPVEVVARDESEDRYEEYDAVKPDGTKVHIRRNIETGKSVIVAG